MKSLSFFFLFFFLGDCVPWMIRTEGTESYWTYSFYTAKTRLYTQVTCQLTFNYQPDIFFKHHMQYLIIFYASVFLISILNMSFFSVGGHENAKAADAGTAHRRPWTQQRISRFQGQEDHSSSTNPPRHWHTHKHTYKQHSQWHC